MESSIRLGLHILGWVWWLFTLMYMTILFLPSSYFVDVKEFQAIDTRVWEKMHFIAIRDAKWWGGWKVIEEVNIVRDDLTEVLWRNEKEVLTEKWLKMVTRELDYVHREPWEYILHLHIKHDIGFMGIKKVINLSDEYIVTF